MNAPPTRRELLKLSPLLALGAFAVPSLQERLLRAGLRLSDAASEAALGARRNAETYQFLSGRWRQTLFLPADACGVWPMVRHYLGLGHPPPFSGEYNPLQKLAYTTTILFGLAATVTGLVLYQPVQLQPLTTMLGGFGIVRVAHFLAMCGLLAFIPGHLFMVALHGWNNFQSIITGWKQTAGPDPET